MISMFPEVRQALLRFQREFAAQPPGGATGAVIDGRDIGTVICPNATAKLFVDAAPEARARRRWLELRQRGEHADEAAILKEINERDRRDRDRTISPARPAADALLLDTTHFDIDAAFAAALALVKPKVEEALKALP
jgi:cytidylate kinase